jgi:hypothetical protein
LCTRKKLQIIKLIWTNIGVLGSDYIFEAMDLPGHVWPSHMFPEWVNMGSGIQERFVFMKFIAYKQHGHSPDNDLYEWEEDRELKHL